MSNISFQCRAPLNSERELTALALRDHTEKMTGLSVAHQEFGLLAHDGDKLIGSVIGKIYFNWLHIDLFWVADEYRRKGIGTSLMQNTLQVASQAGLNGIEVWTQSWQAPEFYRKLGYDEFAAIDDFTPGSKRHAFRRYLKAAK